MNTPAWLAALLLACVATSCNSQNAPPRPSTANTHDLAKKSAPHAAMNAGNVLKLTKHEVLDKEGTGLVASTYLLPEGWITNDRLYWEYGDATVPIRYKGTFQNPEGSMVIKSYPDVRAVWSSGPTGSSGYRPPSDIVTGLKDLVKSEKRGVNFQYTDQKAFPGASQVNNINGSPVRQNTQAGYVKIEYQQNGALMEEEFYGQLDVSQVVSQGVVTLSSVIWSASSLYSCAAPKGRLDQCKNIALTIKSSARPTLPFFNKYVQVTKMLSDQVYAQIYQAGQISRIISETNDKISESITSSYWNTQKSYERTNQQFSDNMRGIERYSDGTAELQLPSGYSNAWVNNKGEYLMSDQPGFDPSVAYGEDWKQLNKK